MLDRLALQRLLCEERAEFLVLFPECDEGCRERAAHFLPKATR